MRGDPLSLQIKCHTKTQKAPSDIFGSLFPSLKILLTPLYSMNKIIMGFSVEPSLRSLRLGVSGLDGFMRHSFRVMHNGLYSVKVRDSSWAGGLSERSGKGSFLVFRLLFF